MSCSSSSGVSGFNHPSTSPIKMTERYSHLAPSQLQYAIDLLEEPNENYGQPVVNWLENTQIQAS